MYSFYDIAQASRYLSDSIITYKKTPFYISNVIDGGGGKDFFIQGYKLGNTDKTLTLPLSDTGLSFKPISLGIIPTVKDYRKDVASFWLCRMPVRQWKIGLTGETVCPLPLAPDIPINRDWSFSWLMNHPGVRMCMMGEYWTFEEGRKILVDQKKKATAFSREWAMSSSHLYYKATGVDVGIVTDDTVTLHEDFIYLQESLNEAMK